MAIHRERFNTGAAAVVAGPTVAGLVRTRAGAVGNGLPRDPELAGDSREPCDANRFRLLLAGAQEISKVST
jgi:hypothetical protein